ncbi:hypothetical protein TrVE_jg5260 [Triparma verrucosa]|uniref:Lariat debranching enzyme C-terminal domain-containing protein n=1 Tax=Triparma verrucosa TaxID=1606542 RepID=A0A9W7BDH7_9STRA|nr:hypothetical protein TrVE_jg5260 [Triparma verrucosa]
MARGRGRGGARVGNGRGNGRGGGGGRHGGGRHGGGRHYNGRHNNHYGNGGGNHNGGLRGPPPPPNPPAFDFKSYVPDSLPPSKNLRIAVEGCCHGQLDRIYSEIYTRSSGVDLLICCGDFQSLRNVKDYDALNVPNKYKELGDFPKYYSGEAKAPVLTIFIGGNHEASNALQELQYGGWVAENIYYLGNAGSVYVGGVRVSGLSGIFNGRNFTQPRAEAPPYTPDQLRSVYHQRAADEYMIKCLSGDFDVCLSHDWPSGVAHHGDKEGLFRRKGFLRNEVEDGSLGSPPARRIMDWLKPKHWFSAHLHCRFEANVKHDAGARATKFTGVESESCGAASFEKLFTKFLSLDKCLPRRKFLEVLEIERPAEEQEKPVKFCYDTEWLAVLKKFQMLPYVGRVGVPNVVERPSEDEIKWCESKIKSSNGGELTIPENFVKTAPTQREMDGGTRCRDGMYGNPQTDRLLGVLEMEHLGTVMWKGGEAEAGNFKEVQEGGFVVDGADADENEIDLHDDEGGGEAGGDEDEIDLGDDDDDEKNDENEIDLDDDDDDDNGNQNENDKEESEDTKPNVKRPKLDMPPPAAT